MALNKPQLKNLFSVTFKDPERLYSHLVQSLMGVGGLLWTDFFYSNHYPRGLCMYMCFHAASSYLLLIPSAGSLSL
jgi:hypothetical protein